MSNNRFPFAIMLAGFMLFGSDAMAQMGGGDRSHQTMKKSMRHMEHIKHMTPEQRREQYKNLSPKQRKKMQAKHNADGHHQMKCDHDDNDCPKKHKKRMK